MKSARIPFQPALVPFVSFPRVRIRFGFVLCLLAVASACASDSGFQKAGHSLEIQQVEPPADRKVGASVQQPRPPKEAEKEAPPELSPPSAGPILNEKLRALRFAAQSSV
jgi:hypothetical protein